MKCPSKCSATVVLLSAISIAAAQCGSVDRSSPEAVSAEVNRLFNRTLDSMETTLPSGEKITTWMGWEPSTQEQINCLGAAGVPATAELFHTTHRSFGRTLAIHMLGWEGGAEIVPPLAEVLAKPSDPLKVDSLKLAALNSLTSAPPDKALPVVEQALRSEKNPDLLKAAAQVKLRLEDARNGVR
jgi:hypothetical protein